MSGDLRRLAGESWSFRERVEHDAARRFARLAPAIAAFDPGSPVPGLLLRATEDERRHAVLCAGLARHFGGPPAGEPPEVRIAPASLGPREAALYELVAACCITETESVATVTTLLGHAASAEVRPVLHQIARDEVVHSRLGWTHLAREAALLDVTFLARWIPSMLAGTADPALFDEDPPDEPEDLPRAGLLPRAERRALFVRTLEEVVFPGLEAFGVGTGPARAWLARFPPALLQG